MPTTAQWSLPTQVPAAVFARLSWLHPVIVQVLYQRGLAEPDLAKEFFGQQERPDDPLRMKGVDTTVARLRQAIQGKEPIAVYGDFDADGVTSTALMVQTLRSLGAEVMPYIPHRVDEGYGLNKEALQGLHSQGIRVVLTVDCGIRSVDEVRFGRDLGLDIIVSDHHSIGPELPPALAVINPRQSDCPYHMEPLAGVGVAFKLAQALLRTLSPQTAAQQEESLLDLVALGTVADVMPMRGLNRRLVRQGLAQLQLGGRPGIRALALKAGIRLPAIDATAIGFRLGPRLNAAGRLEHAGLAYDLLLATDDAAAEPLAARLDQLNRERQRLTDEAVRWAVEQLGDAPPEDVLLVAREALNPGIVGLVAGRLKETYYRPALVVELGGDDVRGSARSTTGFHITHALDQCADLLVRYGGHAAAAGFTVPQAKLGELRRRLNELAAAELSPEDRVPRLALDAVLPLRELDFALLEKLHELEPTGSENAPALFAIPCLLVRDARRVGDGSHLKLKLSDDQFTIDGIAFGMGAQAQTLPTHVDVAARLEENNFQSRRSLQLVIESILPAGRGIPRTHPAGSAQPPTGNSRQLTLS